MYISGGDGGWRRRVCAVRERCSFAKGLGIAARERCVGIKDERTSRQRADHSGGVRRGRVRAELIDRRCGRRGERRLATRPRPRPRRRRGVHERKEDLQGEAGHAASHVLPRGSPRARASAGREGRGGAHRNDAVGGQLNARASDAQRPPHPPACPDVPVYTTRPATHTQRRGAGGRAPRLSEEAGSRGGQGAA